MPPIGRWSSRFVPSGPKLKNVSWPKSEIDFFILARMEALGLTPSPEADRYTLIRRLSLDLIGLPPTIEQVEAFVNDKSVNAYERLVDSLLKSPHYGERWARVWLDLARYADTQGYEKDRPRTVWPWRDVVIESFNNDMPYDQFTIEQLAGDLLPKATLRQLLATGFHRNTMTNTEGGTDDEEYRTAAIKDRTDTTGQVWLGLSVGCAKCHSHKYDPISQTEYYQLYAFFNQTTDADRFDDAPKRALPSPFHFQSHLKLVQEIKDVQRQLDEADARGKNTKTKDAKGDASDNESVKPLRDRLDKLRGELDAKIKAMKPPASLIMQELPAQKQRKTHLFVKGSFLDHGPEVQAGVPESLHPFPADVPKNRLTLARWLVDEANPLVARVTVNRYWSRIFGIGLVETEEDFGTQGAPPSHPLLLDYLALEFRETGRWSLKKLCKTIVMSATYRQSSHVTADRLKADPRNRYLSRGARFRLEAELLRDQALRIGGLLSAKMYGPPVMPPQPEGTWQSVYNSGRWVTSTGENRFRRGLYTYAKRTSPYPSFLLFDGGSGETCMVRRIRTNTATAALAMLNDPVYVEASQALARRIAAEFSGNTKDNTSKRGAFALRCATGRPAQPEETARIVKLYKEQRAIYAQQPKAAQAMATDPLGPLPKDLDVIDVAAWTVVAGMLLNLDEVLTKP